MQEEQWRQSLSLPEYEVSSHGRVRRIPHQRPMPKGGLRWYGGKAWMGALDDSRRRIFHFCGKTYRVHRLICEAFKGPPPFDRAVVMHLDENPSNNRVENLVWGTQKENLNAPKFLEYCRSRTGDRHPSKLRGGV